MQLNGSFHCPILMPVERRPAGRFGEHDQAVAVDEVTETQRNGDPFEN